MQSHRSFIRRVRELGRANLLGLVAIFLVLAGSAIALPGKNRVNSGDIKQGQVRTLDLHRGAVTKSKLHANAVTSVKVRNDSLTGRDIDESSLSIPVGAGTIGERELADRERRIVIGAGELVPSVAGEPDIGLRFGYPAVFYPPDDERSTGAVTQVPLDRAVDSRLEVSLLWDAEAEGDVVWNVSARSVGPGADLEAGVQGGPNVKATASTAARPIETPVLSIPAGVLTNGDPLALRIARNADETADTMPSVAYLRLVEISYTATG
jgi:hypothetical protein